MSEEFTKIEIPEDTDEELFGGVSLNNNQWFGLVRGINDTAYYGLQQVVEEVKEGLGYTAPGTTQFLTQEMNKERDLLKESTSAAENTPGFGGFEFGGEMLLLLAPPLAKSALLAGAVDSIMASTLYDESGTKGSGMDMAIGGAFGFGAAKVVNSFRKGKIEKGANQKKLDDEINKFDPWDDPVYRAAMKQPPPPRDPTVDNIYAPNQARRPGMHPGSTGNQSMVHVPDATGRAMQPTGRALVPSNGSRALAPQSGGKSLQNVPQAVDHNPFAAGSFKPQLALPKPDGLKLAQSNALVRVTRASEGIKKALKTIQKQVEAVRHSLTKSELVHVNRVMKPVIKKAKEDLHALNLIKNRVKGHNIDKVSRMHRAETALEAAEGVKRVAPNVPLAPRPRAAAAPVQRAVEKGLTEEQAAAMLAKQKKEELEMQATANRAALGRDVQGDIGWKTKAELANDYEALGGARIPPEKLRKMTKPQLMQMVRSIGAGIADAWKQHQLKAKYSMSSKGRAPTRSMPGQGGGQGGFVSGNDTMNMMAWGAGGALLGASASDGNETIGGIIGALAGGMFGRRLGGWLDKQTTATQRAAAKVADKASKRAVNDTAEEAADQVVKVSRAIKAKDLSKEKISKFFGDARKVADEYLGAVMTRLDILAPRVATALRQAEYNQHTQANIYYKQFEEVFNTINTSKLSDMEYRKFKIQFGNSTANAKAYLKSIGKEDAAAAVAKYEETMAHMRTYLNDVDMGKTLRRNYAARLVKDMSYFEKLPEVRNYLERLAKRKGVKLTDFEKENAITEVINMSLHKEGKGEFARAASNLKRRTVKMNEANVDAYADPWEAAMNLAEQITTQVERRRFFKNMGVKTSDLGDSSENMITMADRLRKSLKNKEMSVDDVDEVAMLIRNRFGPGEQAPSRGVQNFKNLTYAGLLANPMSAATQFGDVALGMHRNGIANTVSALVKEIAGRGKIDGLDKTTLLGLRNAGSDFASNVASRDVLNWGLKYSGFQRMDQLGKNTFIRGAMSKNKQLSPDEFRAKWAKRFDPDSKDGATPRTDELYQKVQDFQVIDKTNRDDVGFMLWNELAEVQPISLSELPQRYLMHPNGRMAYMLQSFTLKVFDVMRKDVLRKLATPGQRLEGIKNATKFSSLFVMTNGGVDSFKNFVLGKEMALDDVVINNYLKMLGLNKYMVDGVSREGLGDTILKQLAPPMALPNALLDADKARSMVPLIGRMSEGAERFVE